MKKFIYTILLFCLISTACEDPLDKSPINIISENILWNDETLVDLYMADLYSRSEFFFSPRNANLGMAEAANSGFARTWGAWTQGNQHTQRVLTPDQNEGIAIFHCWKYDIVRDINEMIDQMSDENSPLEDNLRHTRLGEAYFLRAWIYFKMARVYGGVPIIERVQSFDEPEEELFVPRSSEEETYDFIAADCDRAQALLQGRNEDEFGRATEWAALALKSRAMLYIASAGEFGQLQSIGSGELQTTLGTASPNKYWQLSLDASKEIIDNGPFSLYQKNGNLVKNFEEIFQAEGADNPEVIFAERFSGMGSRGHDWDNWLQPDEFRNGWGSFLKSFPNALGKFEFKDGTSGELNPANFVKGEATNLYDLNDFWINRDPRALATFYFAETPWKGSVVYTHVGTYKKDQDGIRQYITSGNVTDGVKTIPAKGRARDIYASALHVKKRMNEAVELTIINGGLSYSDFIVFRLAEIYLNYAEADFYLNGTGGNGLSYLNKVRERAGMPAKTTIAQDVIRNERDAELMFENQRFWDIRRWRTAVAEVNGIKMPGIEMRYDFDEDKYEIYFINSGGIQGDAGTRIFLPHNYYYPIMTKSLNENPALVQNPGY